MSPKKQAQLSHKIACTAFIMIEALDDINACSEVSLDFKEKCKQLLPFCEKILSDTFEVSQVKSTTYLTDLSNKIDTVIRHNYKQIIDG